MEKPLIWIIDEEWPDYELEKQLLKTQYPDCDIRFSTYDYAADLDAFGENADAVICQVYAPMPAATIQRLKKCKIIAVYGGTDLFRHRSWRRHSWKNVAVSAQLRREESSWSTLALL